MKQTPLRLLAGPKALAHIRENGLSAADIACIPAAAGGPKGLILAPLDQLLFGHWLPAQPRQRELIGASIGAWRMACGAASDPVQAFADLTRCYIEEQRYVGKPAASEVSRVARLLLDGVVSQRRDAILSHPHHRLHVLANVGNGALAPQQVNHTTGFAHAALANLRGRQHLAKHLERVVFHAGAGHAGIFDTRFDAFINHTVRLNHHNFADAMVASGSIPLVLEPVRDIADAPRGWYWDGGLIDYHLHLPYPRLPGFTLYPHFAPTITAGWLDKFTPWRKAHGAWLDTMILICPTREFIASLPKGKIPDRKDFKIHGSDWQTRERLWNQAIADSARLADAWHELDARQGWVDVVEALG
jgi:hypothetical protein